MKRILLLTFLPIVLFACSHEESKNDTDEQNPILTLINERALDYGASVKEVKVNKDATKKDEYLILITFNANNKKDTYKHYEELKMYSDDIAANLSKDYAEINTVVALWKTVDKKRNILKRSYEKSNNEMYLNEEYKDNEYFKR